MGKKNYTYKNYTIRRCTAVQARKMLKKLAGVSESEIDPDCVYICTAVRYNSESYIIDRS